MNNLIKINVSISPDISKIKYIPKWEILYNPLPDWLHKRMLETYKEKKFLFTIYTNHYIYDTHKRIYDIYGDCEITRYLVQPYLVNEKHVAILAERINKEMGSFK